MNDTFDYPPTISPRRDEVFDLIPAYRPLMSLYRSCILSLVMLCYDNTEPLLRYEELSFALREQYCQDAYDWSRRLFHPEFTDWADAWRLDILHRKDSSTEYIGLAAQRDDALGDMTGVLYPHPLLRTQMDLMDAVRARLQDMERRVCLLLGYRDRAAVHGDPNPQFLARLQDYLLTE